MLRITPSVVCQLCAVQMPAERLTHSADRAASLTAGKVIERTVRWQRCYGDRSSCVLVLHGGSSSTSQWSHSEDMLDDHHGISDTSILHS
jgi:hypothetical protein